MSITDKIQSLITAANTVTGESRTDLTSAVQDLKDGYGQGQASIPISLGYVDVNETDRFTTYSSGSFGKLSKKTGALSVNLSGATSWRYVIKIKFNSTSGAGTGSRVFYGNTDHICYMPSCETNNSNFNSMGCGFQTGSSQSWAKWLAISNPAFENGKWFYVVQSWKNDTGCLSLYNSEGTRLDYNTAAVAGWYNRSSEIVLGGNKTDSYFKLGDAEIDLSETLIEKDGNALWGTANNKTQSMGFENI